MLGYLGDRRFIIAETTTFLVEIAEIENNQSHAMAYYTIRVIKRMMPAAEHNLHSVHPSLPGSRAILTCGTYYGPEAHELTRV